MDLDSAKENIMPLAGGRNARFLETALSAENDHEAMMALQQQRQEFEKAIHDYEGDDPLEPWYAYIQWIEQSCPSGGKENGMLDVLLKCIAAFEGEQKYFQDRRMIKLYIKYIDTQTNPQEYYQLLYTQGIGTMVADLYICWAYYYDLCGHFAKADEIFRKGLDARAQPLDELEQAHKHFGFTMSQRILYKDEASSMEFMSTMQERRQALTSLRTHKKKVGSIRTGSAVKSYKPGKVTTSGKTAGHSNNAMIQVFEDQNNDPNAGELATPSAAEPPTTRSVVQSIIDSTRKQENMCEPGPWAKARLHDKRKGDLFGAAGHHELGFEILEDDNAEYRAPLPKGEDNYSKGIQLPENFVSKNKSLPNWEVPLSSETDGIGAHLYPMYEKTMLYPKPNEVYCPEEYNAYRWFNKRQIINNFTKNHDTVFSANFNYGFHMYPNFCPKNEPQTPFPTQRYIPEDLGPNQPLKFNVNEIYPENSAEEYCFAELFSKYLQTGFRKLNLNAEETIIIAEDLDETQCVAGAVAPDRRSLFPSRRSVLPKKLPTLVENSLEECSQPRNSAITPNPVGSVSTGAVPKSVVRSELPRPSLSKELPSAGGPNDCESSQSIAGPSRAIKLEEKESGDNQFEIYEDTTQSVAAAAYRMAPKLNKFDIYQDENDPDIGVFKAPQGVLRPIKPRMSTAPCADENEEKIGFDANETCSTQTFNLFIKAQSVSTPKHMKKSQSYFNYEQDVPVQEQIVSPPTPTAESDAHLSTTAGNTLFPPKQLSVIMEVTETNTGSSGTKSTVEAHDFDTEVSKSNYSTKPSSYELSPPVDQIMQISTAVVHRHDVSRSGPLHSASNVTRENIPAIPLLATSMKVFEEQTETVPKVLLVKPGQPTMAPLSPPTTVEDNYDVFFSTTPKKDSIQANMSTINDSLTFSKLSELTLPKLNTGKGNISCSIGHVMEQINPSPEERVPEIPDGFGISDSFTFSKLKDFTLPGMMNSTRKAESAAQRPGVFSDKSFSGKSLLDVFGATAPAADTENIKCPNLSSVNLAASSANVLSKLPESTLPKMSFTSLPSGDTTSFLTTASAMKNMSLSQNSALRISQAHETSVPVREEVEDGACAMPTKTEMSCSNMEFKLPELPVSKVMPAITGSHGDTTSFLGTVNASKSASYFRTSHIQEASIHIKEEPGEDAYHMDAQQYRRSSSKMERSILSGFSEIARRQSTTFEDVNSPNCSIVNESLIQAQPATVPMKNQSIIWFENPEMPPNEPVQVKQESSIRITADLCRSIYLQTAADNQEVRRLDWPDNEEVNTANDFVHCSVNLDYTRQVIETKIDENVNPFDSELIKAFLDQIDICSYIEKLPTCSMVNKVQPLGKGKVITVADKNFDVMKLIGEGSYGSIFCVKERSSGALYAAKQERPANLWEYYVCLELRSRIDNERILRGFIDVEYAVIGNNASLLVSEYSKYGSLINVCHKVHAMTGKNIDEFVVMVIANQLLAIMDHLHASSVIHADVKPDNFLLMSRLSYPWKELYVQLIDFGISIDLQLFPPKQAFNYVTRTEGFTCIEMLENRPWTYQPDLFGLAGTIHVLLFAKYMDVEKKPTGWTIKTHMPRYFNKTLWNTIFTNLLNIRDCNSMPNLQHLRSLLEEATIEQERLVKDKITEFNKAIDQ